MCGTSGSAYKPGDSVVRMIITHVTAGFCHPVPACVLCHVPVPVPFPPPPVKYMMISGQLGSKEREEQCPCSSFCKEQAAHPPEVFLLLDAVCLVNFCYV